MREQRRARRSALLPRARTGDRSARARPAPRADSDGRGRPRSVQRARRRPGSAHSLPTALPVTSSRLRRRRCGRRSIRRLRRSSAERRSFLHLREHGQPSHHGLPECGNHRPPSAPHCVGRDVRWLRSREHSGGRTHVPRSPPGDYELDSGLTTPSRIRSPAGIGSCWFLLPNREVLGSLLNCRISEYRSAIAKVEDAGVVLEVRITRLPAGRVGVVVHY